jgi:hypothetical protein
MPERRRRRPAQEKRPEPKPDLRALGALGNALIGLAALLFLGAWLLNGGLPKGTPAPPSGMPATGAMDRPWANVATFQGSRNTTTATFEAEDPWRVAWDARGQSNFVITALDANGQQVDLAANEIAPHRGEHLVHQSGRFCLEVEAEGPYTITVADKQ